MRGCESGGEWYIAVVVSALVLIAAFSMFPQGHIILVSLA